MKSEYPTVRNLINPIGIIVHIDCLTVLVINRISLIKLILGGAAMFALHDKNHHIDDSGRIDISPLVRAILRLCLDSYVMYAIKNRSDDLSPCAIIIAIAPFIPSLVLERSPAIIRPI